MSLEDLAAFINKSRETRIRELGKTIGPERWDTPPRNWQMSLYIYE